MQKKQGNNTIAKPHRHQRKKGRWLWIIGGLLASILVIVVAHDVPTKATPEDHANAKLIMISAGYENPDKFSRDISNFEGQISTILAIQDAVLKITPDATGIPFDTPREPGDLLAQGKGLCFDRSRVIEKVLTSFGLDTRHAAVYSLAKTGSTLVSLLTPGVSSHAVTEVKTAKGWMMIDSNGRWIGLTETGDVMSLADLQTINHSKVRWSSRNRVKLNDIFKSKFIYIIGLYSRHGRFFAPYTPIPDYNIKDLLTGLTL